MFVPVGLFNPFPKKALHVDKHKRFLYDIYSVPRLLRGEAEETRFWTGISRGLTYDRGELTCTGIFRPQFNMTTFTDLSPAEYWPSEYKLEHFDREVCFATSIRLNFGMDCTTALGYICERNVQGK